MHLCYLLFFNQILDSFRRKNVNGSEREDQLVSDCYHKVCSKGWSAVVDEARKLVLEYGLPPRVVKIYTESTESKLTTRMKNIMRRITPSTKAGKAHNVDEKMRYAVKRTPAQRKLDSKLQMFVDSSSDGEHDEEQEPRKKKKTATEVAREAQEAHTSMCNKAMGALDRVTNLLTKVEAHIDKTVPKP